MFRFPVVDWQISLILVFVTTITMLQSSILGLKNCLTGQTLTDRIPVTPLACLFKFATYYESLHVAKQQWLVLGSKIVRGGGGCCKYCLSGSWTTVLEVWRELKNSVVWTSGPQHSILMACSFGLFSLVHYIPLQNVRLKVLNLEIFERSIVLVSSTSLSSSYYSLHIVVPTSVSRR